MVNFVIETNNIATTESIFAGNFIELCEEKAKDDGNITWRIPHSGIVIVIDPSGVDNDLDKLLTEAWAAKADFWDKIKHLSDVVVSQFPDVSLVKIYTLKANAPYWFFKKAEYRASPVYSSEYVIIKKYQRLAMEAGRMQVATLTTTLATTALTNATKKQSPQSISDSFVPNVEMPFDHSKLTPDKGVWVSSEKFAKDMTPKFRSDGIIIKGKVVSNRTLQDWRHKGKSTLDNSAGCDLKGNIWRKTFAGDKTEYWMWFEQKKQND